MVSPVQKESPWFEVIAPRRNLVEVADALVDSVFSPRSLVARMGIGEDRLGVVAVIWSDSRVRRNPLLLQGIDPDAEISQVADNRYRVVLRSDYKDPELLHIIQSEAQQHLFRG